MKNDPYFTTARFASVCPETKLPIKKGDEIAYYPRDRKAFHISSKSAANARLIAAAPDLLAALENLAETAPIDIEADTVDAYRKFVLTTARNAIAKATT